MVQTDAEYLHLAFTTEEESEFLMEMIEPEIHEGKLTLEGHLGEELESVDDIEAFMNNVTRQKRRMEFLQGLYKELEGSRSD